MGAGIAALASGQDAILGNLGEVLTFRGGPLTGLVNRVPFREQTKRPDFSARDVSRISLRLINSPEPEPGEEFVDAFGYKHRIVEYRNLPPLWTVCECKVSSPS